MVGGIKDYFVTFENYIEIRFWYEKIKFTGTQLAHFACCLQPFLATRAKFTTLATVAS